MPKNAIFYDVAPPKDQVPYQISGHELKGEYAICITSVVEEALFCSAGDMVAIISHLSLATPASLHNC